MQINTQLSRLRVAKEEIYSALAEKGANIPQGTLLSAYAPYIRALQGGAAKQLLPLAADVSGIYLNVNVTKQPDGAYLFHGTNNTGNSTAVNFFGAYQSTAVGYVIPAGQRICQYTWSINGAIGGTRITLVDMRTGDFLADRNIAGITPAYPFDVGIVRHYQLIDYSQTYSNVVIYPGVLSYEWPPYNTL